MCTAKIHRATVTAADPSYVGSIAIDQDLLDRVDILSRERVSVWNVTTGARIETYALSAPPGSGNVIINGAAARLFQRGDIIIVAAFSWTDELVNPRMILVDERNRFVEDLVDNRAGEDQNALVGRTG
jgi:aspartate 1-decarboxylase